ncbi:MAG: prenyltransferase [Syntrophaceae bacterium PtaU1.Bin231]|nr:MAG: prenyltransferase [Syntrophaceae bacterium PtaU1.Bin231]
MTLEKQVRMNGNNGPTFGERIRIFFGLSRMSHSILDMAHPGVGALLVLGAFPDGSTLVLGFLAAFAGFTSVFALNDVMDWRVDSEKMEKYRRESSAFDLDALGFRHPIAQGKLRYASAFGWVFFWGVLSLWLAYLLKPLCAAILVAAISLEVGYCSLLRVTHWKVLLSGCMVGIGSLAGIYAVMDAPPPLFALLFFAWTFSWEVGGRNIPNDWADLDEDINLGIRTFPVRYGRRLSSRISFAFLGITVLSSLFFPLLVPVKYGFAYQAAALAAGIVFLIVPGTRWVLDQSTESAMALFNRACLYPLCVFILVIFLIVLQ